MTRNIFFMLYIQIIFLFLFVFVFVFNTIGINVNYHNHTGSQSISYVQIIHDEFNDIQTPEIISDDSSLSTNKNQTSTHKQLIIKYIEKDIFQPPKFLV